MSMSRNPTFVATRAKMQYELDKVEAEGNPIIGGPREGMTLADFCDEVSYGAIRTGGFKGSTEEAFSYVALVSTVLESDIVRWMRTNPQSVKNLMGDKK